MAGRGRSHGRNSQQGKVEWSGFANIPLSEADKEAIRGGVLDGESVLDIVAEILGTGHKISLTYDRDKDTIAGAVTGVYSNCKNAGLTCTSFARDLPSLLSVIAYKHDVVAKGNWHPFIQQKREVDDIG